MFQSMRGVRRLFNAHRAFSVRRFLAIVAGVGLALPPAPLSAGDWPQFRGPNASGVAASGFALPTTFSHEDKESCP